MNNRDGGRRGNIKEVIIEIVLQRKMKGDEGRRETG